MGNYRYNLEDVLYNFQRLKDMPLNGKYRVMENFGDTPRIYLVGYQTEMPNIKADILLAGGRGFGEDNTDSPKELTGIITNFILKKHYKRR